MYETIKRDNHCDSIRTNNKDVHIQSRSQLDNISRACFQDVRINNIIQRQIFPSEEALKVNALIDQVEEAKGTKLLKKAHYNIVKFYNKILEASGAFNMEVVKDAIISINDWDQNNHFEIIKDLEKQSALIIDNDLGGANVHMFQRHITVTKEELLERVNPKNRPGIARATRFADEKGGRDAAIQAVQSIVPTVNDFLKGKLKTITQILICLRDTENLEFTDQQLVESMLWKENVRCNDIVPEPLRGLQKDEFLINYTIKVTVIKAQTAVKIKCLYNVETKKKFLKDEARRGSNVINQIYETGKMFPGSNTPVIKIDNKTKEEEADEQVDNVIQSMSSCVTFY